MVVVTGDLEEGARGGGGGERRRSECPVFVKRVSGEGEERRAGARGKREGG